VNFEETKLQGVYEVRLEPVFDERGSFARSWCQREFEDRGLNARLVQCNVSFNAKRGTLRGMHFQHAPHAQSKLVRCTLGAIWDAIIDLRPTSATFKRWFGAELTAENRKQLYIPEGFAHGFITLADETEVFYQMGNVYNAAASAGVRWNDPAFGIEWPREVSVIIERDATYPDFK